MTAKQLSEELTKLNQEARSLQEDGTPYTAPMLAQLRAAAENATNDTTFREQRDKERSKKKPAPKAQ